jgi:hypothetical protein
VDTATRFWIYGFASPLIFGTFTGLLVMKREMGADLLVE